MESLVVKWLPILSSTVLFGTGIGSASSLLVATPRRDARTVATVSGAFPGIFRLMVTRRLP